jgi:hypothetical protein
MKILLAHGPVGRYSDGGRQNFNWCLPSEVVNVDGFVCCSSEACGCNRAFVGIFTRMGATQAYVAEVEESVIKRIAASFGNETIFNWLVDAIQKYPENTVLRVKLGDKTIDGCELIVD